MERLDLSGAGKLDERLAFDARALVDDGFGNIVAGDWEEKFQRAAQFIHRFGSETVMAARLESRSPMEAIIRKDPETKQIGTDWQARDARRGTAYNIRDVVEEANRSTLRLTLEAGVATG
jgi:basic membrane lipoprotein Med (substrate-binding protein (PBP1-ABC) superfamily)